MKRKHIITDDGSSSIFAEEIGESYHSHFGAFAESLHIFIESGYKHTNISPVHVLEIGFGTGLNALLTWNFATRNKRKTYYYTIEKYPLDQEEWESLNYHNLELIDDRVNFSDLHKSKWEEWNEMEEYFDLYKAKADLLNFESPLHFDLIYFDAFSPKVQPDLWTEEIFTKLFRCLNQGGFLLSYSVKGTVKRALKSAGFKIELIPGPKGKREIMRASK
ncbi:MAG: tRNA (5-methylaminomethyl-2-thiouridine)(34)-methyltransferase MnmD [Bacteroidales bacterium]|nr:tRNA (5-methylaminomethyl-2-thiouridine)(34)-methyltransferase MnmD [Bacteroidales bacterium]MCF8389470.1 tRNA (5-methylaminomethyl-2-thiouridine)(34)-methyltransferase MnmD [Bacteroidales bacterium]